MYSFFYQFLFLLHKSLSGSLSKIIHPIYRKESHFYFQQLFSVETAIFIKDYSFVNEILEKKTTLKSS